MNRAACTATVMLTLSLWLAGCDRKSDTAASSSAAPAPAESAWPLRRPGLWRISVSDGRAVVQTSEICIDRRSDRQLSVMGAQINNRMCAQHTETRDGADGWRLTAVCEMGSGGRTSTIASASGDFDRHYVVRAVSATEGAALASMNGKRSVTVDATRIGECAPGQTGGDMVLPDGARLNVLDAGKTH